MSEGRRRVVEKAYAYVTRRDGAELLVFEPPSGEGLEVPKGGVEPGEDPAEAVIRELREETGLADAEIVSAVATDDWPHPSKPKTYRRHFFHVAVTDAPDEWVHVVTGGGEDDGLRYTCYWVWRENARDALIREQGAYLSELDAGEDA